MTTDSTSNTDSKRAGSSTVSPFLVNVRLLERHSIQRQLNERSSFMKMPDVVSVFIDSELTERLLAYKPYACPRSVSRRLSRLW
jgi:hypothetical protein